MSAPILNVVAGTALEAVDALLEKLRVRLLAARDDGERRKTRQEIDAALDERLRIAPVAAKRARAKTKKA